MTLILTCSTNDYILQAVDRRVTRPDGTVTNDDANKAIFWCRGAAVTYTGPTTFDGEPTIEWIGKRMSEAREPHIQKVMMYIAERASKYFRENKDMVSKFTIVVGGWAKVADELQPYLILASNIMTTAWKWEASPSDRMNLHSDVKPKTSTEVLYVVGQTLKEFEDGSLRAKLNRAVNMGAAPYEVARLLGETIQSVSAGNDSRAKRVGKGMIIQLVSRKAVESNSLYLIYGLTPDTHSFHYVSADGRTDRFTGPAIACPGGFISNFGGGSLPRR